MNKDSRFTIQGGNRCVIPTLHAQAWQVGIQDCRRTISVNQISRGFTLVETLIAIAILMVAIAGPLTVANQALTAALGSRNVMIATYLAQEGMESVKNIKDNNLAANPGNPSAAFNSLCVPTDTCKTPTAWTLSGSGGTFPGLSPECYPSSSGCLLYVDSSNYSYTYSANGSNSRVTPFQRYYTVSDTNSNNANERIVTVTVSWTDASTPNQIQLQALMTNTPR